MNCNVNCYRNINVIYNETHSKYYCSYNLYHETIQPGLWPKAIMWRVMEVNALIYIPRHGESVLLGRVTLMYCYARDERESGFLVQQLALYTTYYCL